MNRVGAILAGLLLVQSVLALLLYFPKPESGAVAGDPQLAAFPAAAVEEIRISDESGSGTVLLRQGDRWLLPELGGLPADGEKVRQLLEEITSDRHGWPVAETPAARQRFQVADYLHQRRLTLRAADDDLATLFLGTSPGYRRVHARNEQHDAIFSIALNNFDVPAETDQWLDRRLLQTRAPMAIDADGYSLSREGGKWQLGTGEVPDARELEALLGALRSLQVEGIADEDLQRELTELEAELVLQVRGLSGEYTLQLFAHQGQHFALSSEYPLFFRLNAYDFDRLVGIDSFLLSGD